MSDAKLYKQAGNSVCVSVIERIAKNIQVACEEADRFKIIASTLNTHNQQEEKQAITIY